MAKKKNRRGQISLSKGTGGPTPYGLPPENVPLYERAVAAGWTVFNADGRLRLKHRLSEDRIVMTRGYGTPPAEEIMRTMKLILRVEKAQKPRQEVRKTDAPTPADLARASSGRRPVPTPPQRTEPKAEEPLVPAPWPSSRDEMPSEDPLAVPASVKVVRPDGMELVDERPAEVRRGMTPEGGRLSGSGASTKRTWSDGSVDYACAYEGCDYSASTVRSVGAHYGTKHTRGGGEPAKGDNRQHVDPSAEWDPTPRQASAATRLANEIQAAMDDDAKTAQEIARSITLSRAMNPAAAPVDRPMTVEEQLAAIRRILETPAARAAREEAEGLQAIRLEELAKGLNELAADNGALRIEIGKVQRAKDIKDQELQTSRNEMKEVQKEIVDLKAQLTEARATNTALTAAFGSAGD